MKPTITKEQAGAIQIFMDGDKEKSDLLRIHAKDRWIEEFSCLNELDIMTLAAALVNGYEVGKTPEEEVREYYEWLKRSRDERHLAGDVEGNRFIAGLLQGVLNTLDYLGIKIEGVNA
ncbi:hypothetical protein [Bacillus subtilis]|uniref:Phage protein n=1 Tax=Bacillus subtilis subsp. subtilis TaxID=135461 RepID=A0ABD3ZQX0_BACIU|nr:hypothetical protein [Bacillus subtilis]KIL30352.1 hypothetical protein B4067_1286 [Bacillus subtilis subsp. subtilis]KIN49262.1 hypothetical protein B4145_1226 [Bacillus subtilis]